MKLSEEVSW